MRIPNLQNMTFPELLKLIEKIGKDTSINTEEARDYYPQVNRSFYLPSVPKDFYSAPGLVAWPKKVKKNE